MSILEHIIKKIEKVDAVNHIYIVTNDRFYGLFSEWLKEYYSMKKIEVLNDGTDLNDNRLGAIADMQFVIDKKNINEDILVMAGDNLFDFELTDFYAFYCRVKTDCLTTHEVHDANEMRRTGIVELDQNQKVISFEEKPQNPKSNFAVPPFYIYTEETLTLIKKYLEEGNNPDAPGNFIPWLIQHKNIYAFKFEGNRYDIGTIESYREAQKVFAGANK